MLNVTIKFTVYCAFFLFCGCEDKKKEPSELEKMHYTDSVSEWRIDSAYAAIKSDCDTLMVYQVPVMVDSLLKDSTSLQSFFDSTRLFTDADKKVEKVVRQLQADCDSNLLKETYKRARLLQKARSKPHTKPKA